MMNKPKLKTLHKKYLNKHEQTADSWTINDIETERHFRDLGVDSITTDFPKRIRDGLK